MTPGQLRWRCRRGMKELDLVLGDWLERRWAGAGEETRAAFERLLGEQDPQIAAWLLGRQRPADASLAALIDELVSGRN